MEINSNSFLFPRIRVAVAIVMLALTGCASPVPLKAGGSRLGGYWTAEKGTWVAWPTWPLFGLPEVEEVSSLDGMTIAFRDDGSLDATHTSMGLPFNDFSRFERHGDRSSLRGEQWYTNISYELMSVSYAPSSTCLVMQPAEGEGALSGRISLDARMHGPDRLSVRYTVERPLGLPCTQETHLIMRKATLPSATRPGTNSQRSNWSFQLWIGKPLPPVKNDNSR